MKNCSTLHILDGHKGLASQLAFSTDGKCLAAVAESELCVWKFVGGLLSYLGTATTGESDRCLQPKVRRKLGNEVAEVAGEGAGEVRWIAERRVVVGGVEVVV